MSVRGRGCTVRLNGAKVRDKKWSHMQSMGVAPVVVGGGGGSLVSAGLLVSRQFPAMGEKISNCMPS